MVKVSAFEFDCRIDRIYSAIASVQSSSDESHIDEMLRLHMAIQLLINARLQRKNDRLQERSAKAISAAYSFIRQTINNMEPV